MPKKPRPAFYEVVLLEDPKPYLLKITRTKKEALKWKRIYSRDYRKQNIVQIVKSILFDDTEPILTESRWYK